MQILRQPVIPPRLAPGITHALLHYAPLPIVGDDEGVQVKIKPVLNCGAINLRHELARSHERRGIQSRSFSDLYELIRRPPRMFATSTAYVQTEFALYG